MQSEVKPFKTWVEISRDSLGDNLKALRKIVGEKRKIACVIKANAYGHGILEVVKILEREKVDFFAVDNIKEALLLKNSGISTPVLILGYIELADLKEAILSDFSFVCYNKETLRKIISLSLPKPAKIHLKIETGLNRQGVDKNEIPLFTSMIKKDHKILLEGISTHFTNIEDTLEPSFAKEQIARFKEGIALVRKSGLHPKYLHAAGSAGAILYGEARFNMVRAGIALYGLWPSRETKIALNMRKKSLILKPVLSWKSIVSQVKKIKTGESVGYGRTWYAPRKSKIAIIPVGYSDGYDRKLSNSASVIIKGRFAPVIGRVAMNMIVADVTEIANVNIEDEVTLIGKSGTNEVTADELAQKTDTINYEVVSRINPLLPRVIV